MASSYEHYNQQLLAGFLGVSEMCESYSSCKGMVLAVLRVRFFVETVSGFGIFDKVSCKVLDCCKVIGGIESFWEPFLHTSRLL